MHSLIIRQRKKLLLIVFIVTSLAFIYSSAVLSHHDKHLSVSDAITVLTGWKPCYASASKNSSFGGQHHLAIIIPHRDRFSELQQFLPYMKRFLIKQNISPTFYVINQVDSYRFNRGALINVGTLESKIVESNGIFLSFISSPLSENADDFEPEKRQCYQLPEADYLALHDVDLLPVDGALKYSYPADGNPQHLIPALLHPRYFWFKSYSGGILLITRKLFEHLHGMSNQFWGWGREDDEFRLRVKRAGLTVSIPVGITSHRKAYVSIHNERLHRRDSRTYHDARNRNYFRQFDGGLRAVNYTIVNRQLLMIQDVAAIVFNVKLYCPASTVDLCHPMETNGGI